jgi:hypothetical protein
VTDDAGAAMLVDGLGLEFSSVSTELNLLEDSDPALWMAGKLRAYRAQEKPFVHIDTDVFLWQRLPEEVEQAAVFAQNPEQFEVGASHYKPEVLQRVLTQETQGWIPKEWEWSLSFGNPQPAECCGIFGGHQIDFIHYYADQALRVIDAPENSPGWALIPRKGEYATTIEQYHLAACIRFHRNRSGSPFPAVDIRYLFDSFADAFNPNLAAKLGFTHLLAGAKRNQQLAERLEQRVRRDFPDSYERCLRFIAEEVSLTDLRRSLVG